MTDTTLKIRLSRNLKRLRKEQHLSQFQLAELADISEHTVNSIETRRMWASDAVLQKICDALAVDAVSLLMPCTDDIVLTESTQNELRRVVEFCVRHSVSKIIADVLYG